MSDIDLEAEYHRLRTAIATLATPHPPSSAPPSIPSPSTLATARTSLTSPSSPSFSTGHGPMITLEHIRSVILPALSGQAMTSRYFGFVTGGILPVAEAADNIVTAIDQNSAAHIENHSVTADVEDAALKMVCEVLDIPEGVFPGRLFTTGATGSNVAAMVCGREAVVERRGCGSIAEMGIFEAYEKAGIRGIQVLTSSGHSSLAKAAAVAGIGSGNVIEASVSPEEPWLLDLVKVEEYLRRDRVAFIISVSMGEVNTGLFATRGLEQMAKLKQLADHYGAWLHVDGAFGIFVRALPLTAEYSILRQYTEGIELADSITVSAHKILNVPYDCGIFLCKNRTVMNRSFRNLNAAYLQVPESNLVSPLDLGLENSRRFRALPVYAILMSDGKEGISNMVARMVQVTRAIAQEVSQLPQYEMLPVGRSISDVSFILMIRLKDEKKNASLVDRINESREMFVSGSQWDSRPAARIAISSYKTQLSDVSEVIKLLRRIADIRA